MARINRRAVVAGVGASALAGHAGAALPPIAASRTKVVFLSDVHIGDNSPTVWYQKDFHEPFLVALLDHVIGEADQVRELIILGDFIDYWTYPPNRRPPGFREIAAANPAIFGPRGKLAQVLSALKGRVTYIPGNHDMGVTQRDVDFLVSREGYKIQVRDEEAYFPLAPDRRLACSHGHRWTMFNAPDLSTPLAPLPLGHFVTRSVAYMLARDLPPGRSVADLPDQGAPNGIELTKLAGSINGSLIESAVNYAVKTTGISEAEPILLPDGRTTNLGEVKLNYQGLWARWATAVGGDLSAAKAAAADVNGRYLAWFAQRLALQNGAELVVFGHTHAPKSGLKDGFINYVNTGFDCPSRPDIGSKHPTFIEVDTTTLTPRLRQVTARADGTYAIEDHAAPADTLVYAPNLDFSTYVTVDNTQGTSDLVRRAATEVHGRYVVGPPTVIPKGHVTRFWLQDNAGARGSEGVATYDRAGGPPVELRFGCPTGTVSNFAGGAAFQARVGGQDWAGPNVAPRRGHPLFVRFRV
ncbi:MAG: metallophosphoesterase [Phenylobacterium sp.]|uniref:metallophosphoesterase n=1 Tax=Phenylobacterium sp. TaxID=1871053 RepID=UPI003BB6FDD5